MRKWIPNREDKIRWHTLAGQGRYCQHWSRYFYDEARAKGLNYAARPHGNFSIEQGNYLAFNEPEAWRDLHWASDSQMNCKHYIGEDDYSVDGERLIFCQCIDGSRGVAGYWMELTHDR